MNIRPISFEAGPATLIPLVHVPLLKQAPRNDDAAYKVIHDQSGDLCHFYGDFAHYHLYIIASSYKTRLVENSIDYYDRENGLFSASLSVMTDEGKTVTTRVEGCKAPLCEIVVGGQRFPEAISIENFSPGTPDALKFHFGSIGAKFKFSCNLIPQIPETIRFAASGLFDLKIEYIGKAVGQDGTREIADRLGNGHSTESAILNEFVHKKTNRDAFAVLFKPGKLTDGSGKEDKSLSFGDVVDILEKSLIASFLPKKNMQSRNFPNDDSLSGQKLRSFGVNRIWVSIKSPEQYGRLFTEHVAPEREHRFDLELVS